MLKIFTIISVIVHLFFSSGKTEAQTFGFGCLGFVGGYGGFTYQQINSTGLNEFVKEFNLREFVNAPVDEFSYVMGYRVGLNFFRATFENGIIITAKGFYQFVDKKNKTSVGVGQNDDNFSLDLDLKNWSLGFDVGWEFTKVVSWKIIDGSMNFNYVKLTQSTDLSGSPTDIKKYNSDSGVFGYSVGTGLIVAILRDYVSIEGLAGYTYIAIDDVYDEEGISFLGPTITDKLIESGGFTAVIQLNVGLPLL